MATWYTVTLNDNGGSGSVPSTAYAHVDKINSSTYIFSLFTAKNTSYEYRFYLSTKPTRTYYSYNGHWTAKSGGTQIIKPGGGYSTPVNGITGNTTLYAHWTRLSYRLELDRNGGTGGTASRYCKATEGGWYTTWRCETAADYIVPPTKSGYVFMGYYTASQGSGTAQKYINADGSYTDNFRLLVLTADATLYAWWKPCYAITVNANGGTGGTSTFYYSPNDTAFYSDSACTDEITAIMPPTKGSSLFLGYYDTDATTGTQVVAQDGTISSEWTPTGDATIYAQWRTVVDITLDRQGGDSGDGLIVYDSTDAQFHLPNSSEPITAVTPPDMECFRFLGYFSAQSGGTQYIDADGELLPALYSASLSSDLTIYAQWERVSYRALLDPGEGSSDTLSFYCDGTSAVFYTNDLLVGDPVTKIDMPTRIGYDCTGYWSAESGGTKAVDADGTIVCGVFSADVTFYAQWQIRTYTATFDYNGGSGSVATKTVTWNAAIGNLPTPSPLPSRSEAEFGGWQVDGETVTSATVWRWDADRTIKAKWITGFQYVEDFFNLGTANLVPISSDAGDNRQRVCVMNATTNYSGDQTGAGRYTRNYSNSSLDPTSTSGVWRNPTVTYRVVHDCTVATQLGKAFPATRSGSAMTVSGFMITSVKVSTAIGKFPTVTVAATANEGANAINLFDVSIPVVARARAQYLLGAVSGGGNLQTCEAEASCSPVVVAENGMPCASDVVGGRYPVRAQTYAPNREAAPVAANGFTSTGAPKSGEDRDFPTWSVVAEKEIV